MIARWIRLSILGNTCFSLFLKKICFLWKALKSEDMSEGTENSFSAITQEKIILNCSNVLRLSALERPTGRVYAPLGASWSTRVITRNIVNVRRVRLLCSFVVPRNWVWGVVAGLTHYRCTYKWTQYFCAARPQKCRKKVGAKMQIFSFFPGALQLEQHLERYYGSHFLSSTILLPYQ